MIEYFRQGFYNLEYAGVFDILLPFVLVFAVIFGILQKIKIFGDGGKKFNVIISLVMGLVVAGQHVFSPGSKFDIVPVLNGALPQVSLFVIAIVMLIILLGLFGGKLPILGENKVSGGIAIAGVVIVGYIFLSASGWGWWDLPYWMQSSELVMIIVAIIVFALVIGYITGDESKPSGESMMKEIGKLFSK